MELLSTTPLSTTGTDDSKFFEFLEAVHFWFSMFNHEAERLLCNCNSFDFRPPIYNLTNNYPVIPSRPRRFEEYDTNLIALTKLPLRLGPVDIQILGKNDSMLGSYLRYPILILGTLSKLVGTPDYGHALRWLGILKLSHP